MELVCKQIDKKLRRFEEDDKGQVTFKYDKNGFRGKLELQFRWADEMDFSKRNPVDRLMFTMRNGTSFNIMVNCLNDLMNRYGH